MKKKNLQKAIVIILIIIFFLAILFFYIDKAEQGRVCIKTSCFSVEIAETPEELSRGLMFRQHLDADKGMLFVFEKEGIYPLWMKNMIIPLDIIWIDKNRRIISIKNDLQPCGIENCPNIAVYEPIKYILEINAGISEKFNFSVGDEVNILP